MGGQRAEDDQRQKQAGCLREALHAIWYAYVCILILFVHCSLPLYRCFILRIVFSESSLYTLTSCVPTPILSILYVTYCYRSECIRYCYCMYVLMVCFPPDLESFFNAFRGFLSFLCWTRNLRQQKGQELQKDSRQWFFSHFSNV